MTGTRFTIAAACAFLGCSTHSATVNQTPDDAGVTMRAPTPRHCPGAIPASTLASPGPPARIAKIAVGTEHIQGIALSPTNVYFIVVGPSDETIHLHEVGKTGGENLDLGQATQTWEGEAVAADANDAYTSGYRFPADGGALVPYLDTPDLTIDDQFVFSIGANGDIVRSVKGSTDVTTVVAGASTVTNLTAYGDWIYWQEQDRGIFRAPKLGGEMQDLNAGRNTRDFAVDCQELFYSYDVYGEGVYAAMLPPSSSSRTVTYSTGISYAVDDGAIYTAGPVVYRVNLDGLTPAQRIGLGVESWPSYATQIAVDESYVYWAADDGVWVAEK